MGSTVSGGDTLRVAHGLEQILCSRRVEQNDVGVGKWPCVTEAEMAAQRQPACLRDAQQSMDIVDIRLVSPTQLLIRVGK